MTHTQLLSFLVSEPWALRAEVYGALVSDLQRLCLSGAPPVVGPTLPQMDGTAKPVAAQVQIAGDAAIIPVRGILARGIGRFEAVIGNLYGDGCTDYDWIDEMTDWAEAESSIAQIVYNVGSPGGASVGNEETAARIAACTKPTYAWVGSLAASAAYFLASQCDEVYCAPSAILGSVGSYFTYYDYSAQNAALGIKVDVIRSGEFKGMGVAGTALSTEQRALLQEQVDGFAAAFKSGVKAKRPTIQDTDLRGQSFMGRTAVSRGFADATAANFGEVLGLMLAGQL